MRISFFPANCRRCFILWGLLSCRGDFAAAAASDFLLGQKVTKEPPRGELRMSASRSYSLTPWTPITGTPIKQPCQSSQRRGWLS